LAMQAVCAVIVTYHPNASMLENIPKVLAQVQRLIVVDNGSSPEELAPLRSAGASLNFELVENGRNLGIAEALNQGVRRAKHQDFRWVILFDQDSKITEGFVQQMFATWENHSCRDQVCSIHPRYVGPSEGEELTVPRMRDGGPFVSMTSGSLMPTWIFDQIGWFASDYFIDLVDWEYCARIRAAGFLVADSREATLRHAAGNPTRVNFLGFSFQLSHHSAVRHYYIARNSVVFHRKYFCAFPWQILKSAYRQFRWTLKCFILEQERGREFRNFLLGTCDGLRGRMGPREGL
jgi:rhamnosyltransferase